MSEEMNRRESALSDAELENVSGAGSDEDRKIIEDRAERICTMCGFDKNHCGATPYTSLKAYLKEHGIDSVRYYQYCPYNKR